MINDDVHNYRLPKKSEIEEGDVMDNKDNNDKIVTQKSLLNDGTKTGFSIEDSGNIHDDKDEDNQDRQKEEEESVSNVPDENITDFELSILQAYIDTVWIKYDTNNNGSIFVDETMQLLSDITGHESISREECELFVKSLDEQEKMEDHEINHKIDKEEFIFFVDDMMQMSTDDRKEYATRGAFQQILIEFTNAIENRFKKWSKNQGRFLIDF